jgi:hypothetical protein
MKSNQSRTLAFCTLLAATSALAAEPQEARQTWEKERAACANAKTDEDRLTCRREAGAVYMEARKGLIVDDPSQFEKNRLARCDLHPPQDRPDCLARMKGEGVVRGSVEEGGIYREYRRFVDPEKAK